MRLIKEYNVAFSFSSDKREGDEDSPEKIKVCNIPVIMIPILYDVLSSIAKMAIGSHYRTYMDEDLNLADPLNGSCMAY